MSISTVAAGFVRKLAKKPAIVRKDSSACAGCVPLGLLRSIVAIKRVALLVPSVTKKAEGRELVRRKNARHPVIVRRDRIAVPVFVPTYFRQSIVAELRDVRRVSRVGTKPTLGVLVLDNRPASRLVNVRKDRIVIADSVSKSLRRSIVATTWDVRLVRLVTTAATSKVSVLVRSVPPRVIVLRRGKLV